MRYVVQKCKNRLLPYPNLDERDPLHDFSGSDCPLGESAPG